MSQHVLALTAHPDDAEFWAAGTLARMIAQGVRVDVLIATNGDTGSFELDSATLAEVRREEALRAARVLGVNKVLFLDHGNGKLERLPPGHLRGEFMRAIRELRPDTVFTFDPFAPFENHHDHRATAFAGMEAANTAHFPLHYPEHLAEGLEPHQVTEKYFFAKNPTHANKAVDITETLDVKIAALLEHKSQVAFLFEDWRRRAELAGVSLDEIVPGGVGGEDGPARFMAWFIREQARANGEAVGLAFAERFRTSRFPAIMEGLLESRDRP